jgi:glycosyltransferase involved in cell wall biosynthesis
LTGTRVYTRELYRAIAAHGTYALSQVYAGGIEGVERRGLLSNARNILWLVSTLTRELERIKPALLHAAAYLGPPRSPCPVVLNVFDTTYAATPHHFDWKFRFYARTFIPAAIRRAAAILTLSEHARGEIERLYGVPRARVHVVPPGVGGAFHPPADGETIARVRSGYDLPGEYVMYAGEDHPRKNLPRLIAAFARARREIPSLHLVLAGPRAAASPLQSAIEASGAAPAIHSTGYVPETDLAGLYAGARAFVFASAQEGFGMPPVEAMACGTPVVVAPNPPMREVLGDAAWFTADDSVEALAQGIVRVAQDDALCRTLRARGLERAQLYSWFESARKTMAVYAQLLGDAARV